MADDRRIDFGAFGADPRRTRHPGKSFLDQEVSITFKPRHFVKILLVILILVLVFTLGRWSASCDAPDTTTTAAITEKPTAAVEPKEQETETNSTGFFAAFWQALFSSEEETVVEPAKNATASPENKTSGAAASTTTPALGATAPSTATENETIVKTYSNVKFNLNDVKKEWKETWGKVTQIDYTISNGETGTIKPAQIGIKMEGYDDFEKKVNIPLSGQTVKAGAIYEAITNVPGGFAYNEKTTGALENVQIIATLYNGDGKVIATVTKEFNLKI